MIIGIPQEIKDHEFRVAATPGAVQVAAVAESFGLGYTPLHELL